MRLKFFYNYSARTKNNKNLFLILVLLFFFLFNLSRFDFNYFNLEWYFVEYAKHINDSSYYFTKEIYRENQANTSFYSLLISSIFNYSLNEISILRALRAANFLFFIFCILIFFKYEKDLDYKNKIIFILIVLFSPIFFVYIFRIYPDVSSFVFAWTAFYLLEKKKLNVALSIFFTIISFLLKPISIILVPFFVSKIYQICKYDLKKTLKFSILYLVCIIFSYLLFFLFYEKSLFSKGYSDIYLNFLFTNSLFNFFNYIFYIFSLLMPFSIINIFFFDNKKKYLFLFLYFFASFFLTFLYQYNLDFIKNYQGEMNLGYLSSLKFFNSSIYIFFIFYSALSFFHVVFFQKKHLKLFFLILFSILILSILVFRPTQRYLIYVLPFLIYLQILIYRSNKIKFYFYTYLALVILFLSAINIGQQFYQYNSQRAFKNIYEYIESKNIVRYTDPGVMFHSYGYKFNKFILNRSYQYKFTVIFCDLNINSIYKVKINNLTSSGYLCLVSNN